VPDDPGVLPEGLPEPVDDGGADHLRGAVMPSVELPATDGRAVRLDGPGRSVVYAYPRMGDPLVPEWDLIPGARGCTPEACGFRDHHAEIVGAGAEVYGLSTQPTPEQRAAVERLALPFPLLSDPTLELARALRLPTFDAAGETLLKRLTLVVADGRVDHVFYPVFPPDRHAAEVLAWLRMVDP
jgi:peroxiredoxin